MRLRAGQLGAALAVVAALAGGGRLAAMPITGTVSLENNGLTTVTATTVTLNSPGVGSDGTEDLKNFGGGLLAGPVSYPLSTAVGDWSGFVLQSPAWGRFDKVEDVQTLGGNPLAVRVVGTFTPGTAFSSLNLEPNPEAMVTLTAVDIGGGNYTWTGTLDTPSMVGPTEVVPEPASLLLVATALGAAAVYRCRGRGRERCGWVPGWRVS